jgi:hypothetical protein
MVSFWWPEGSPRRPVMRCKVRAVFSKDAMSRIDGHTLRSPEVDRGYGHRLYRTDQRRDNRSDSEGRQDFVASAASLNWPIRY